MSDTLARPPQASFDPNRLDGALAAPVPMELADKLPGEFRPRFSVLGDLSGKGRFGRCWVGADDARVVAISEVGPTLEIRFTELTDFRVEELFGASRLVAVGSGVDHVLATYSRNLVSEFALFARVLDDLRKGEAVVLPDTLERATCTRCGAPLPERGATCPRCPSRGSILKRLVALLGPYRWQVAGLVGFAMLGVAGL
jgi:ribosomal protein L40E